MAQVVAIYLATSPNANLIGVYYVPIVTIAYETGHSVEDVRAAIARIRAVGFAHYDEEHDLAWIPNHAEKEIGSTMKERDKRRGAVLGELRKLGDHPFVGLFLERYGEAYGIGSPFHPPSDESREVPEAPSMVKPNSEAQQDKTQQDHDQEQDRFTGAPGARAGESKAKGAFGFELASWASGVASVTGRPCTTPNGRPGTDLVAALAVHRPPDIEPCAHAEKVGADFARTKPGRIDPWTCISWLNAGAPSARSALVPAGKHIRPKAKAGEVESWTQPRIIDLRNERG